jgi:hypothetical protein
VSGTELLVKRSNEVQADSPVLKYKGTLAGAKYRPAYPLFLSYLAAVFRFGAIFNGKPLELSGRHCGEQLAMLWSC